MIDLIGLMDKTRECSIVFDCTRFMKSKKNSVKFCVKIKYSEKLSQEIYTFHEATVWTIPYFIHTGAGVDELLLVGIAIDSKNSNRFLLKIFRGS